MNNNELKIMVSTNFKLVRASQLSLDDDFLKYTPKTEEEEDFMFDVEEVIKKGVSDFWRPICDPSFDENGRICYHPGWMPAVDKSYSWWASNARVFYPERGSRLGTDFEYIAFLAVIIKELVASGKSIEWAWDAVCNDSKELGHYDNSQNVIDKYHLEPTGSREICGWYDLANTSKILAVAKEEDAGTFRWASGNCSISGNELPLAFLSYHNDRSYNFCCCSGWIVLTEAP